MIRALFITLIFVGLAAAAAPAEARPFPVEFYPCFAGGTTVVVNGQTVLVCFEPLDAGFCPEGHGDFHLSVAGRPLRQCYWGPPPP